MRVWQILKQFGRLVRRRRRYVLLPLLLFLVLVAVLAFYVVPSTFVTFMYAGV